MVPHERMEPEDGTLHPAQHSRAFDAPHEVSETLTPPGEVDMEFESMPRPSRNLNPRQVLIPVICPSCKCRWVKFLAYFCHALDLHTCTSTHQRRFPSMENGTARVMESWCSCTVVTCTFLFVSLCSLVRVVHEAIRPHR